MDEGGGGAADAGGALDSYYDGGYEDEKMRQVNNLASGTNSHDVAGMKEQPVLSADSSQHHKNQ